MTIFTTDFERSAMPMSALVGVNAGARNWAIAGGGATGGCGQTVEFGLTTTKRAGRGYQTALAAIGNGHPSQRLGSTLT